MQIVTLNELFGANVRQYRRVKGLTQAQLAEAVDLSVEMVGKIEQGTSSPSFEKMQKLCNALDVPVAVLFGATADSAAHGRRGELLGRINSHLANLNDTDLERLETMVRAFARRRSVSVA